MFSSQNQVLNRSRNVLNPNNSYYTLQLVFSMPRSNGGEKKLYRAPERIESKKTHKNRLIDNIYTHTGTQVFSVYIHKYPVFCTVHTNILTCIHVHLYTYTFIPVYYIRVYVKHAYVYMVRVYIYTHLPVYIYIAICCTKFLLVIFQSPELDPSFFDALNPNYSEFFWWTWSKQLKKKKC